MSECQNRLGCKVEEAGSTMAKSVAKRETTAQLAAHAAAAIRVTRDFTHEWRVVSGECRTNQVMTVGLSRPVNSCSFDTSRAVPMMDFSTSCASSSNLEASSVYVSM